MTPALRTVDAQPLSTCTTRLTLAGLYDADLAAMQALCEHVRHVPARQALIAEGDAADAIYVLLEGWAARVKSFDDGRRQFTAVLIPGDVCNLDALHVRRHHYGVTTLTACRVAVVSRQRLSELAATSPAIARALAWMNAVDAGIATQWIGSHGRRSARQHLAHFLCELLVRVHAAGEGTADGFCLPMTQEEIADAIGLTGVHVNRTLQGLRTDGLITLEGYQLRVLDWPALKRVASFDPGYLYLEGIRPQS